MGTARPAQWQAQDSTIRRLFGLPESRCEAVAVAVDRVMGLARDRASGLADEEVLLAHESFRALFSKVAPGVTLCMAALGSYLGVSRMAIARRLNEVFAVDGATWRSTLAVHTSQLRAGPAFNGKGFAWWFVRAELGPMFDAERARVQKKREMHAVMGARCNSGRRLRLLHTVEELPAQQFLVDVRDHIVGGLGQGHIRANAFIDVLNGGGRIIRLDAFSALRMPWTSVAARAPWDAALREALAARLRDIHAQLDTGLSCTRAAERLPHVGWG